MKEKHTDSTQNRFTAYLMAAVGNRRSSYIERKIRQREREQVQVDILEKNHTDFDAQFHAYMVEKAASASGEWEILKELRALAESEQLIKALGGVISAKEAMTLTGLKKDSFYRLVKKYKAELAGAEEEKV